MLGGLEGHPLLLGRLTSSTGGCWGGGGGLGSCGGGSFKGLERSWKGWFGGLWGLAPSLDVLADRLPQRRCCLYRFLDGDLGSRVCCSTFSGHELYYEVGVLTEAEYTHVIGVNPADLKHKHVMMKNNEEGTQFKAFLISLAGMSLSDVLATRKLKCFHRVSVLHSKYMHCREDELIEGQSSAWHDYARKTEVADRPKPAKLARRGALPTLASLREEAEALLATRRDKIREAHGLSNAADAAAAKGKKKKLKDGDCEDDEIEQSQDTEDEGAESESQEEDDIQDADAKPKAVAAPSAANRLQAQDSVPKNRAARRKKEKVDPDALAIEDHPEADRHSASTAGKTRDPARNSLASLDPELYHVAEKRAAITKKTVEDFAFWKGLNVENAWSDKWDGRTMTAAGPVGQRGKSLLILMTRYQYRFQQFGKE